MSAALAYLPESRRRGIIRVVCMEGEYRLRMAELDRLNAACDQGDVWFVGEDNYGCEVRIRLDQVEAIVAVSAPALARMVADEDTCAEERKAHGLVHGDDD